MIVALIAGLLPQRLAMTRSTPLYSTPDFKLSQI